MLFFIFFYWAASKLSQKRPQSQWNRWTLPIDINIDISSSHYLRFYKPTQSYHCLYLHSIFNICLGQQSFSQKWLLKQHSICLPLHFLLRLDNVATDFVYFIMSEVWFTLTWSETSSSSTRNSILRAGRASGEVHLTSILVVRTSVWGICKSGKMLGHSAKKEKIMLRQLSSCRQRPWEQSPLIV